MPPAFDQEDTHYKNMKRRPERTAVSFSPLAVRAFTPVCDRLRRSSG
jgi:hypothetical protein